jgi:hypothetical protein
MIFFTVNLIIFHWGKADDRNCNYGHPKMADMKLGKNRFYRLNLRHEHRFVLHFPAQLHVDTRLAVSFTVRFFWPHGDFKMKNNNKSVVPLLLYYV